MDHGDGRGGGIEASRTPAHSTRQRRDSNAWEWRCSQHAKGLGLDVRDVTAADSLPSTGALSLAEAAGADVLNARFFLHEDLLRALYQASHAVLANSGREPFGLVGLEVMSCQGLTITGATGEEYLRPFDNGISVETNDPFESVSYLELLARRPESPARFVRPAALRRIVSRGLASSRGCVHDSLHRPPAGSPPPRADLRRRQDAALGGSAVGLGLRSQAEQRPAANSHVEVPFPDQRRRLDRRVQVKVHGLGSPESLVSSVRPVAPSRT